jgi:predicted amidohydrolase
MKIAVGQLTCTSNISKNLNLIKTLLLKSKECKVKMLFLPEASDYIASNQSESIFLCKQVYPKFLNSVQDLAKEYDIWISIGIHAPSKTSSEKLLNQQYLLNNHGEIKGEYSKVHLFDVNIPNGAIFKESNTTQPGDQFIKPIETLIGKIGLAICYDIRFPEMSNWLRNQGAEIITYPSAFTVNTGKDHWKTLLKCRAIETQCYVIAAAQVGDHNEKRSSFGNSLIIDPWGQVLAECNSIFGNVDSENPELGIAEIDLNYLKEIREKMPIWNHRKHCLY